MHPLSADCAHPSATFGHSSGLAPVRILGWMMFLVPALGVPSYLVLQDTLKSAVLATGVLAAALVFFWQLREREVTLRWHGLLWLPLALTAYALGSMVWSHTYLAAVEAIRWALLALLMWLGLNTLRRDTVPTVLWGVHAGAVGASAWLALQFWFDLDWFPQAAVPASTFVNRNFFAEFAVSALPFSVYLLLHVRRLVWLVPMAFSVSLVVVAIMMTGTRSALVALWLLLVVFTVIGLRYRLSLPWVRWSHAQRALVASVLVAGTVAMGMLPTGSPRIAGDNAGANALTRSVWRTTSLAQAKEYTEGSFSIRADMWKSTTRMMLAKPWTGVGAGAWEVEIPLYQRADTMLETDYYAHNEYLQMLSEYGLLVGGLVLAFLGSYLLISAGTTWQLGRSHEIAPLRAMTLASLLALLLVSNAGFPWHLASTGALLALCLAILAHTDDTLGRADAFMAQPLAWRPPLRPVALGVLLGALALTAYLGTQAVRAEQKMVSAISRTMYLNNPPPGQAPLSRENQLAILTDAHDSIGINPHYRKLSGLLADQRAQAGDWATAVWIWESIVASRPHLAAIWRNLAQGYSLLGEHESAQKALTQLQRLQGNTPDTHWIEVTLLQRADQFSQAAQQLNHWYDQGTFTIDMVQLGYTMGVQTQQWTLAIRALELQATTWPTLAGDAYMRLGLLYASANPAVHDEALALQAFRQGMAALPTEQQDAWRRQIPERFRTQK